MKSLEYIAKLPTFAPVNAEIAQLVEHNLAKVRVASSSLVFRSQEKATQVVFSFFMHFSCRKFFVAYMLVGIEGIDIFAPAI